MSLVKRTYVDQETVITAENMNDIQDAIIANGTAIAGKIGTAEKGASGGVAELDQTGKVPSSQLPSYVDDVVEYDSLSEFPATGEAGKIYVAKDTNKIYRWGGSNYVEISESLALGETSTTAYRGDHGKAAYDDSQTNKTNIGTMSSLTTTEKGTLVGAINEVNSGKVDKVTGKGLSTEDYTTAEKTKLSGIQAEANKTLIDNTLANAGQAADAKKTGDEISGIKNTLNHKADAIYDTASGDIASFPDGADGLPVKDLTVGIEPVQDLHGYENPWPAGGGKNLANLISGNYAPSINSGSDVPYSAWTTDYIPIDNAQNYAYRVNVDTSSPRYLLFYDSSKAYLGYVSIGYNVAYHLNDYASYASASYVRLRIDNGTSVNPKAQLEIGPDATAYEPYSNICPISGWTGCNISHSGADTSDPTVIPITFPSEAGTVYGGTLDVTSGVLTVDMASVDFSTVSIDKYSVTQWTLFRMYLAGIKIVSSGYTIPNAISDRYKTIATNNRTEKTLSQPASIAALDVVDSDYSDAEAFRTAMANAQIVYELANPQTYQLTPTEVTTLLGQNNIWADCGPSTVEYPCDTKLYIQKINTPTDDDMIADANIASGKYFIINNNLYLSTAAILAGDPIKPGTNCTLTNLAAALNALNS